MDTKLWIMMCIMTLLHTMLSCWSPVQVSCLQHAICS